MIKSFSTWMQRRFVGTELGSLAILLLLIVLTFWLFGGPLMPVFVSIVLAYLLHNAVRFLEKRKFPHALAVNIVFILFFSLFVFGLFILLPLLWEQASALMNELPHKVKRLESFVMSMSEEYPTYVSIEQVQQWVTSFQSNFSRMGQIALSFSVSTISGLILMVVYLVLVPMMVYFFLRDQNIILQWLASFFPQKRQLVKNVWEEVNVQIGNYINAKILEIVVVSVLTTIVFLLFGLNYAILLGVIVGLSVLIPYVGVIIVTLPVVVVGYMQWGWDMHFVYLLILYFALMILDGYVLAPLLFSETMNLHPVAVIIAILIFGTFWGFWGIFFAVPLASVAKALLNVWLEDGAHAREQAT